MQLAAFVSFAEAVEKPAVLASAEKPAFAQLSAFMRLSALKFRKSLLFYSFVNIAAKTPLFCSSAEKLAFLQQICKCKLLLLAFLHILSCGKACFFRKGENDQLIKPSNEISTHNYSVTGPSKGNWGGRLNQHYFC